MKSLEDLGACHEAIRWADGTGLSLEEAWKICHRGDWMLWYAARVGADRRAVVMACCEIARGVLPRVPSVEDRPRLAIEAAERWAENPTEENRRAADAAAADAAAAAADAASAARTYDRVLAEYAERVVQILIDMQAPGCQWLDLA